MSMLFRKFLTVSLILLFMGILGCSTTDKSVEDRPPSDIVDTTGVETGEAPTLQILLNNNRSSLSDVYVSQTHDMPEHFLKTDSSSLSPNGNPFDGYRVQILSTRNLQRADSLRERFRLWADSTISGYTPPAYVSFRQPHYKVHIGDFQRREQANKFSQLIKTKYPDAWVVHDRINPSEVPADTVTFSLDKSTDEENRDLREDR